MLGTADAKNTGKTIKRNDKTPEIMNIILIFISINLILFVKIETIATKGDLVQTFENQFKQKQSI